MVTHKLVELLFYCLIIAALADQTVDLDVCSPASCRHNGPDIRFPFRIKGKQAEYCGYPGFDVSCENRHTVIELPNSVKLFIENIDYRSQVLDTSDPQSCLPRQLQNLSLSDNQFEYDSHTQFLSNYTLFNCPTSKRSRYGLQPVPCLNRGNQNVHVLLSHAFVDNTEMISCTKLYDVFSIPTKMFSKDNSLSLSWSEPNCGFLCESKHKFCKWKNNAIQTEIECYKPPREGLIRKYVIAVLMVVFSVGVFCVYSKRKAKEEFAAAIERFLEDYKAFKPTRYSYSDVKRITDDFKHKLGQGAYGTVFKGKLSDEISVAVKILTNLKGNGEEFANEVGTMGRIHHVNVVHLIGFCADGFTRALVYDYLPNKSLEKYITSPNNKNFLGWKRLHNIALGIARGIEYLHLGCDQRILHFDIKPCNVLLDQDFNPKITDFGLAKLCAKDQSAVSMTTARGTIGYIAPEVFSRNFGSVSYKSDVYSFGMLVLELVAGRKNFDPNDDDQIYFPEWVYTLLEEGEDLRLHIEQEADANIAKKLAIVGLWCIQWNPVDRPSMKFVVQMLEGEAEILPTPPNPFSSANATQGIRRVRQELPVISESE